MQRLYRYLVFTFLLALTASSSLIAQSIKVLAPDGGESFRAGDVIPILWTGTAPTTAVNIDFSTDGGVSWQQIATNVLGSRFLWTVPAVSPSANCLIRVGPGTGAGSNKPTLWKTYSGHQGNVNGAEISPDGRTLATIGADMKLILWDLESGTILKTLTGHSGFIVIERFSPDGSRIVTGCLDGTAIIWNVSTGAKEKVLKGTAGKIWSIAYSPDGSMIAAGNDDGSVTLYNSQSGAVIRSFVAHVQSMIRYIDFSPDGSLLMTGAWDGRGATFNPNTGAKIKSFVGHSANVNGIQLTSDNSIAVTGSYDGTVKYWNASTGSVIQTYNDHGSEVSEVRMSLLDKWLCSVSYDGTAILREGTTGKAIHKIEPNLGIAIRSSFSRDLNYLAISHVGGKATVWVINERDVSDATWSVDNCDQVLGAAHPNEPWVGRRMNLR